MSTSKLSAAFSIAASCLVTKLSQLLSSNQAPDGPSVAYGITVLLDGAGQKQRVRLLEVSKAKTSPFGLLSALAIGAVAQVGNGEQVSMQSLAAALVTGQLQKAAFQNGVTPNGATMAVMPDIQVSNPACLYCLRDHDSSCHHDMIAGVSC